MLKYEIEFVVNYPRKYFVEKILKKEFKNDHEKWEDFIKDEDPDGQCILENGLIYLRVFDGSPYSVGNLTHEAIHYAEWILEIRGVNENKPSEALAYLTEFIVRSFLTQYQKLNARPSKRR
jgi:hypothetical protein